MMAGGIEGRPRIEGRPGSRAVLGSAGQGAVPPSQVGGRLGLIAENGLARGDQDGDGAEVRDLAEAHAPDQGRRRQADAPLSATGIRLEAHLVIAGRDPEGGGALAGNAAEQRQRYLPPRRGRWQGADHQLERVDHDVDAQAWLPDAAIGVWHARGADEQPPAHEDGAAIAWGRATSPEEGQESDGPPQAGEQAAEPHAHHAGDGGGGLRTSDHASLVRPCPCPLCHTASTGDIEDRATAQRHGLMQPDSARVPRR